MKYLIEFEGKDPEFACWLNMYLGSIGATVDSATGVQRPSPGVATLRAEMSEEQASAVHELSGVIELRWVDPMPEQAGAFDCCGEGDEEMDD